MWRLMRGRRLLGVQFRRQVVIGDHIVDFLAREAALVVEIDGVTRHKRQRAQDAARDRKLARRGFRVLRIPGSLVERDLVAATALVIQALLEAREGAGCVLPAVLIECALGAQALLDFDRCRTSVRD